MSVEAGEDDVILLHGVCPIEDAETLVLRLSGRADAIVDWSGCQQAHTAVIQVLMAAKPRLVGRPGSAFLRDLSTLFRTNE